MISGIHVLPAVKANFFITNYSGVLGV